MAVVREERLVEKTEQVLVDVVCDRCGGSCISERIETADADGNPVELPSVEKATVRADWGFFSGKDGERWDADLCETCSDKLKQWIDAGAGGGVRVARMF